MSFKSKIVIDNKKLKAIKKDIKKLSSSNVEWGWINNKKYPNDGKRYKSTYVATVAYFNEFGTQYKSKTHIPARPYFQQSLLTPDRMLTKGIERTVLSTLLTGNYVNYLNSLGNRLVDNLKSSIYRENYQKLSTNTILLKGFDMHWKESGRLISNITYKISNKKITK